MNWEWLALLVVTAYLVVGRVAAWMLAPSLARVAREYTVDCTAPEINFKLYRMGVRFGWPIFVPYWLNLLSDERAWERYDPKAIERREREAAARIRELEQELRIQ